ncbi:MAG: right-handed parallel beta-helix repeat-containing protein [Parcubacteria group bacterium]|nr:right-handed parallel beta-helix repeat-containing protein [Parcubacteria group bacterium]
MNLLNKKLRFVFAAIIILASFLIIFSNAQQVKAASDGWHIKDDATGGECSVIGNWDAESKTCTLSQDLSQGIVIDSDYITLDGDNANRFTITGFHTGYGVYLNGRSGVTVKNLQVKNFSRGIFLFFSNNNTINSNSVSFNDARGIEVQFSNNNEVTNNTFSDNLSGIGVFFSSGNSLSNNFISNNSINGTGGILILKSSSTSMSGNVISGNQYNFYLFGTVDAHYDNSIDTTNLVDGKPIYYVKNAVGQTYDSSTNAGVFFCISCSGATVKDLDFSRNALGVMFYNTTDSKIEHVTSHDNFYYGLFLHNSKHNEITESTFSKNEVNVHLIRSFDNSITYNEITRGDSGIIIADSSDNNIISNNHIAFNDRTIRHGGYYGGIFILYDSDNNQTYNNNLIDNFPSQIQVQNIAGSYPVGNTFNLPAPTGGNYYNDFDIPSKGCNDINNDSFCDSPYIFTVGQDNLPWTKRDGWLTPQNQPPTPFFASVQNNGGVIIKDINAPDINSLLNFYLNENKTEQEIKDFQCTYQVNDEKGNKVCGDINKGWGIFGLQTKNKLFEVLGVLKIVPNDWVLKVIDSPCQQGSECWWKVEDQSSSIYGDIEGYIVSSYLNNTIKNDLIDKEKTIPIIPIDAFISFPTGFNFTNFNKDNQDDVKRLQIILRTEGYDIYPSNNLVTGHYGPFTTEAVKKLQKKYNLFESGELDEATKTKLNNILNNRYKLNKNIKDIIIESVNSYGNNSETASSLYSSNDGNNDFSFFSINKFPKTLLLAIKSVESGNVNFDNEWVSFDYGHGIGQITFQGLYNEPFNYSENLWDNRGIGSGVIIPLCRSFKSNEYFKCYGNAGTGNESLKPYKHYNDDNDEPIYKQYSNTAQSVYANIKDGLRVLQKAFVSVSNVIEKIFYDGGVEYKITETEMKNISAVYRYNQGSPYKVQAVYKILEANDDNVLSNEEIEYIWNKFLKYIYKESKNKALIWIQNVKSACNDLSNKQFKECLKITNLKELTKSAFYLSNVANYLEVGESLFGSEYENADLAKKMKHINENSAILWLASPGELRVIDLQNRITGLVNNEILEDVPNTVYDKESGVITLLFPNDDYRYEVIGTGNGEYGLVLSLFGKDITFSAENIPTTPSQIHQYTINWDALSRGEKGVTVKVDENGDGTFDYQFTAGKTLEDKTPPTTNTLLTGTTGTNGWHTSDVMVTLTAEDNTGGVGVRSTEYSLDNGATWQVYVAPLTIAQEGIHAILYRSMDFLGNLESTQTQTIKIDKTPPEARIFFDQNLKQLKIEGIDNLSPVAVVKNDKTYILTDEAGHTLAVVFDKLKTQGKEIKAEIKALRYDSISMSVIPENKLQYEWSLEKDGSIKELNQRIEIEKIFDVRARYNVKKNETMIDVKIEDDKDEKKTKQIYPGTTILTLTTRSGKFAIKYDY